MALQRCQGPCVPIRFFWRVLCGGWGTGGLFDVWHRRKQFWAFVSQPAPLHAVAAAVLRQPYGDAVAQVFQLAYVAGPGMLFHGVPPLGQHFSSGDTGHADPAQTVGQQTRGQDLDVALAIPQRRQCQREGCLLYTSDAADE